MIDPPRVLSEEPTAVTPHGGICGGESQQWLSYPTIQARDRRKWKPLEPRRARDPRLHGRRSRKGSATLLSDRPSVFSKQLLPG